MPGNRVKTFISHKNGQTVSKKTNPSYIVWPHCDYIRGRMKNKQHTWRVISLVLMLCLTVSCTKGITGTQTTRTPTATPGTLAPIILKAVGDLPYRYAFAPNLWTQIDNDKITQYLFNSVDEYVFAGDGSLWVVGGFGIMHFLEDGQIDWFSMKTGLPTNDFTTIAINPTGEVWVGGAENSLLRYDGSQWIDEGSMLPEPTDTRHNWLCYYDAIKGIDFDQNGNVWVMTGGVEIYTHAYDKWMDFQFPKELLPIAGGGGCIIGMRVISESDITLERHGCCGGNPVGYHFDGVQWIEGADYSVVDELIEKRHDGILPNGFSRWDMTAVEGWPINARYSLPAFEWRYNTAFQMLTDDQGVIWISDESFLYNNSSDQFISTFDFPGGLVEYSDATLSDIYPFQKNIMFYEDRRFTSNLSRALWQCGYESDYNMSFYPSVDEQNRIWAYLPTKGLFYMQDSAPFFQGKQPEITSENLGGTLLLQDGRVAVGSLGALWMFDNGSWQKLILPNSDQILTILRQDKNGTIYAATDTGVYIIDGSIYTYYNFVEQDRKPVVAIVNGDTRNCAYTKKYLAASCWGLDLQSTPIVHYTVQMLDVREDGTIYYANDRLIASYQNGDWKSFYFPDIQIRAATVDLEGNFWIFAGWSGLLKFSPNIFDDYQPYEPDYSYSLGG